MEISESLTAMRQLLQSLTSQKKIPRVKPANSGKKPRSWLVRQNPANQSFATRHRDISSCRDFGFPPEFKFWFVACVISTVPECELRRGLSLSFSGDFEVRAELVPWEQDPKSRADVRNACLVPVGPLGRWRKAGWVGCLRKSGRDFSNSPVDLWTSGETLAPPVPANHFAPAHAPAARGASHYQPMTEQSQILDIVFPYN